LIIPIGKKHAREVAGLHYLYIRSLLRDLGKRMCIAFYQTELQSDHNFGFVYVENSNVLGFTFATEDNSQLFKNPRIRLELCFALLKKPWLIQRLFFHLRKKFPPAPELLYSATDLKIRRKGIGKKFYMALHEGFKKRGVAFYEIRINADNIAHLKLSQKMGAKIKEEFMENGIRRYRLQTRIE